VVEVPRTIPVDGRRVYPEVLDACRHRQRGAIIGIVSIAVFS
jgi:hypothetical protein